MTQGIQLADLTTIYGVHMTFDSSKVSAVYIGIPFPNAPGFPQHPAPPTATEVYGISAQPLFVADAPADFLGRLSIANRFLKLALTTGNPIWIKAEQIAWISADASPEVPGAKCTIGVGSQTWRLEEDSATVKRLWTEVRSAGQP